MNQIDPRAMAARAAAMAMGCGLLALTGIFSASDMIPADRRYGLCALGLALALLALGAKFDPGLGGPTDAWVKRLRLTWLAALATGVLFAIGWVGLDTRDGLWRWFGLFAASFSVMSAYCAAWIYVCREEYPGWSNRWSLPSLLTVGLLSGVLWLNAFSHIFNVPNPETALVIVVAAFLAFYVKRKYWRLLDLIAGKPPPPVIGKHRRTAFLCLFAFPLVLTLFGMGREPQWAMYCTFLAALSVSIGLIAERWLFLVEGPSVQLPSDPAESD